MRRAQRGVVVVAFTALLTAVWMSSCVGNDAALSGADADAAASCTSASEGCACTAGGGCDPGLTCASRVCVRLEAGVNPGNDGSAEASAEAGTDAGGDGGAEGGSGVCTGTGQILCVTMNGAHEVPPVTTAAMGGLDRLTYDTANATVTGTVSFSGLTGAPTSAHFHTGACGVAGAVTATLIAPSATSGTITINLTSLTSAQVLDATTGKWYMDIHTAQNAGGEIRGQLLTAGTSCPP